VPGRRRAEPRYSSRDPLLDTRPAATLDLHGFSAAEARSAVSALVRRQRGGAVLHVITGKGRGSSGGAVLRPLVSGLLKGELRPLVADWSLDDSDGGFRVRVR
jgi:DNA-nicking Smr family endonuclease